MRTSRTISISRPPAQLKQIERLAKRENRTLSELVREALRQYGQQQAAPVNNDLIAALRAVAESAKDAGISKLSSRTINAEVSAYRKERSTKKTKQPVR